MKVNVAWQGKIKEIDIASSTVGELLEELKINSETVLVSINNEISPETSSMKEKDSIEILKVVSGG